MNREKVINVIESLKKEESAIILVEGERDCRALRKLGVEHTIEKISGKRIFDGFPLPYGENVIILTDFDRTGRILLKKLRNELEVMGFNPNTYYWQQLDTILKGKIKGIEELSQFAEG